MVLMQKRFIKHEGNTLWSHIHTNCSILHIERFQSWWSWWSSCVHLHLHIFLIVSSVFSNGGIIAKLLTVTNEKHILFIILRIEIPLLLCVLSLSLFHTHTHKQTHTNRHTHTLVNKFSDIASLRYNIIILGSMSNHLNFWGI